MSGPLAVPPTRDQGCEQAGWPCLPPLSQGPYVDPECSREQGTGLIMETCSVPGASSRLFFPSSPVFCRGGSVSRVTSSLSGGVWLLLPAFFFEVQDSEDIVWNQTNWGHVRFPEAKVQRLNPEG